MLSLLEDILPTSSNATTLEGWVNGNLYIPTREVSGILLIPEDIRQKSCMGEYNSNLHSKQLHYFLASMQGTRKAVLLVHNDTERVLFCTMMTEHSAFRGTSGPDWDLAIKAWNEVAEREQNVSYKVGL